MRSDPTERTPPVERPRGKRVERYLFLVLEGARLGAGGLRVALGETETLSIGRGQARGLFQGRGAARALEIPDPRMSGTHAKITREGAAFRIEDAGSTNGTLVNGEAVSAHELRDGDVIELGHTVFLYREIEEEASSRARDLDPSTMLPLERGLATLDPNLARRLERLALVAPSPLSIVLLGETGTGKEVLARALHVLSKREGPFVAVNCGAIPQSLVESHLFGHVRGAFSGAVKDEPGLVRSAEGGTLLLDEIGDLPPSAQATLLRVLQENEVLPVGSTRTERVDVRILAATHRSLEDLMDRGDFRRDLYARLAGYTFTLTPLRERLVDLGLLIAALLASGNDRGALAARYPRDSSAGSPAARTGLRMHRTAARAMLRYEWPMNVRELEQCLRAASALAEDGLITAEDLPESIRAAFGAIESGEEPVLEGHHEDLRRELIARLIEAKGNVTEVARAMGKARQQVQRWLRRFAIDPGAYRSK